MANPAPHLPATSAAVSGSSSGGSSAAAIANGGQPLPRVATPDGRPNGVSPTAVPLGSRLPGAEQGKAAEKLQADGAEPDVVRTTPRQQSGGDSQRPASPRSPPRPPLPDPTIPDIPEAGAGEADGLAAASAAAAAEQVADGAMHPSETAPDTGRSVPGASNGSAQQAAQPHPAAARAAADGHTPRRGASP